MFTGIIESLGIIKNIKHGVTSCVLTIEPKKNIFDDIQIGDSIATNGVCLTVTKSTSTYFEVDVMTETMKVSSLSQLSIGNYVNLERAMKCNGRFGGHIVSGHVDGVGRIIGMIKDDISVLITIETSKDILKYIILRGSICIDGISLTVMGVFEDRFQVSIIPHTLKETILFDKKEGDIVNLETDIIGKYVEKLLKNESASSLNSNITEEFLRENGF